MTNESFAKRIMNEDRKKINLELEKLKKKHSKTRTDKGFALLELILYTIDRFGLK